MINMIKCYLFLFMFLLTLSGCGGILDSYDEHFGATVNLWGEEYSINNTIELDLSNTGLTESIPSKIGDLKNLEKIHLSNNQLTGEISEDICDLSIIWYRTEYGLTSVHSSLEDNQFCPPYSSWLNGNYYLNGLGPYLIIGNQNTSNWN